MSIMPINAEHAMIVVIKLAGSLDAKTTANAPAKKREWTVSNAHHSVVRIAKAGVFVFSGVAT